MMEPSKPEAEVGEKCNINGNCSPPPKKPIIDVNHAKNIDDISTPSELKFDEDFDFVDPDITEKRREIEECLADLDGTNLEQWQNFAKSKGGLISGLPRRGDNPAAGVRGPRVVPAAVPAVVRAGRSAGALHADHNAAHAASA
ncbi:hypothetical protein MSG28_002527 [Choristoneura fumiferana]|uniref:Uncharacterized protein n=2 Tax=Choristoneura fumiferana TaxID=7141 RepID=A0ACC0JWI9_CHOFU|nr:hypothetical protein MSG28_002527 [Choristoneura fumiferana]KAI8428335.1 hypothetical protein MSG28_002527 [Choristoneura fumiferana]